MCGLYTYTVGQQGPTITAQQDLVMISWSTNHQTNTHPNNCLFHRYEYDNIISHGHIMHIYTGYIF